MKTRPLGDWKGHPGAKLVTDHGTAIMTIRLSAGMINGGNAFGGAEKTAIVNIDTGDAEFWSDATPIRVPDEPQRRKFNTGELRQAREQFNTPVRGPFHPRYAVEQQADQSFAVMFGKGATKGGFKSRAAAQRCADILNAEGLSDQTTDPDVERITGGMPVCKHCGGWGEHMSTCPNYPH